MHNLPHEIRSKALASLDLVVSRAAASMEQADVVALVAACRIVGEIDRLKRSWDREEAANALGLLADARYESSKRRAADAALAALAGWERIP